MVLMLGSPPSLVGGRDQKTAFAVVFQLANIFASVPLCPRYRNIFLTVML